MSLRIRYASIGLALLVPQVASARAVHMMESAPRAESIVDGRNERYVVRFDGPVDHRASSLRILRDGQLVRALHPSLDAAPEVLFASSPRLSAGDYELAWSAKSAQDGESTDGSVRFTVRGRR
jgi:methionine-rich copper-binding protein CopC